jgi:hypothetical protein
MYIYEKEKQYVFTDEGQRQFLRFRDVANELCKTAGAVTVGVLVAHPGTGGGDSWQMLACIDRLVELKEFYYANGSNAPTQSRILVKI